MTTIAEIKRAAKRLLGETASGPLRAQGHAQALETIARLHGYRDFREASKNLACAERLLPVLRESGGLIAKTGFIDPVEAILAPGLTNVHALAGYGAGALTSEIVGQAIARKRPVRILDVDYGTGRAQHTRMTTWLGCDAFSGCESGWGANHPGALAWKSTSPLVTLSFSTPEDAQKSDLSHLGHVPEGGLLLIGELSAARGAGLRHVRGVEELIASASSVFLVSRNEQISHAGRSLKPHVHDGRGFFWKWSSAQQDIILEMAFCLSRMALYDASIEGYALMGMEYDERKFSLFKREKLRMLTTGDGLLVQMREHSLQALSRRPNRQIGS